MFENYLHALDEIDKCKLLVKYVIPAITHSSINFQKVYARVKEDAPPTPRTPQSEADNDKPPQNNDSTVQASQSEEARGSTEEIGFQKMPTLKIGAGQPVKQATAELERISEDESSPLTRSSKYLESPSASSFSCGNDAKPGAMMGVAVQKSTFKPKLEFDWHTINEITKNLAEDRMLDISEILLQRLAKRLNETSKSVPDTFKSVQSRSSDEGQKLIEP